MEAGRRMVRTNIGTSMLNQMIPSNSAKSIENIEVDQGNDAASNMAIMSAPANQNREARKDSKCWRALDLLMDSVSPVHLLNIC